jgi:hypothetical protein
MKDIKIDEINLVRYDTGWAVYIKGRDKHNNFLTSRNAVSTTKQMLKRLTKILVKENI